MAGFLYHGAMRHAWQAFYRYWMKFAHVLGWVNGRIILTLLYIVVIGPYAVALRVARLFAPRRPQATYWLEKPYEQPTLETLRRIF